MMTVRAVVRYRTSRRTTPYDDSYDASYGTVRRTIVRNRTTGRTVAYDDSYDAVRRVVQYHTTHHRTEPYDGPYGASYGSVRRLVRCRTTRRMVPYDVSYGTVRCTIIQNCSTVHMVHRTEAYDALFVSVRFSFGIIWFRMIVRHLSLIHI